MRDKFNIKDGEYWANVCIAFAQVSFGLFLAAWFIPPLDLSKLVVILSTLVITLGFLMGGLIFRRKNR